MKKMITLMLCIAAFTTITKATNFYVDPVKGGNTKDGLSWANAVSDITVALTKASTAPYDVTVDNIFVKQGSIILTASKSFLSSDNIYGSCVGTETSPEQRPLTDLDGNGTIEPWEFQYPTIFNSSVTGNALYLTMTNSTFNGFTITHTSSGTTAVRTITCASASTIFENNIIKNCIVSTTMATTSLYSIMMKQSGVMKNCLFEKNQIVVDASYDGSVTPMVETIGNSKISACVFRNNNITINHNAAACGNLRGMILNVNVAVGSSPAVISNCLVYNNEINYVPSSISPLKTPSCVPVCLSSYSTSYATSDSIINCTIANNKTTNLKCAGLLVYFNNPIAPNLPVSHYAINNLLWNNHNDGLKNNLVLSTSALVAGLMANNLMNGGNTYITAANSTYISNNIMTLDSINTAASGPNFKNPTTTIGNTTDNTAEQSVWSIQSSSFALGKGIATSIVFDKAGLPFTTTLAVGAYSTISTPVATVSQDSKLITVLRDGVYANDNGTLQVYSFSGSILKSITISNGQVITFAPGEYLLRFISTDHVTTTRKVIF